LRVIVFPDISVAGLTPKAAFACGSMVLFVYCWFFFTLQAEKEPTESKNRSI
jgi:hypothetical protein